MVRRFGVVPLLLFVLCSVTAAPFSQSSSAFSSRPAPSWEPAPLLSDTTQLGIVWTPPSRPDPALRELNRIDSLGATAVRLTRPPSDAVAARADTLGLRLYVDLPIDHVSAQNLQDALARATPTLKRLRTLARQHPSIARVGLARAADTTVPAACNTLRRWHDRVRSWTGSLRTYYVTPFIAASDRCLDAVDQVLLDVRGHPTPVDRWRQWQSRTATVGLGAVGTWVRPSAGSGLRTPHSPERQARYLERTLSRLLDATKASPPVIFVSRWRDQPSSVLPTRRYGLHDPDGRPRPAARVVQGIYTGTQRVFAFSSGTEPGTGRYGLLLVGWGLIALLGGLYARSPFVRQTVLRYFAAPGFYRDTLRDGHNLAPGANGLLAGLVTAAIGTTGICAFSLAATEPETEHVLGALPPPVQTLLARGIEHPITAGVTIGGLVLSLLGVWMGTLVLATRLQTQLSLAQGLVLVTWPCWPTLLALPLALAAGPDAPLSPFWLTVLLLIGGGLAFLYMTGRVLYDYWVITDLPAPIVLLLGALSPFALISATVLVLTAWYDVSIVFLWHLATQT